MKKVIAFDLDDTLAVTKSAISDEMSTILGKLLENTIFVSFPVAIFNNLKSKSLIIWMRQNTC